MNETKENFFALIISHKSFIITPSAQPEKRTKCRTRCTHTARPLHQGCARKVSLFFHLLSQIAQPAKSTLPRFFFHLLSGSAQPATLQYSICFVFTMCKEKPGGLFLDPMRCRYRGFSARVFSSVPRTTNVFVHNLDIFLARVVHSRWGGVPMGQTAKKWSMKCMFRCTGFLYFSFL